jgi:hypothetical protein
MLRRPETRKEVGDPVLHISIRIRFPEFLKSSTFWTIGSIVNYGQSRVLAKVADPIRLTLGQQ